MPFHNDPVKGGVLWVQHHTNKKVLAIDPNAVLVVYPSDHGRRWHRTTFAGQRWWGEEVPYSHVTNNTLRNVLIALGDDADDHIWGEYVARKLLEENDDA